MKKFIAYLAFLGMALTFAPLSYGESEYTIFDDKMLLQGYADKYADKSKEVLLKMIQDDELTSYMSAAAMRVFRERFGNEIFGTEKKIVEKILLRRLSRADSNFVEIETLFTLCTLDRYKYFESTVPALIQLLDHYNETVNELAFNSIMEIVKNQKRAREARIVFNTLRKHFFLTRRKYESIKEPGPKLKQKLEVLRWSIKILGTEELQKLPKEIIEFL